MLLLKVLRWDEIHLDLVDGRSWSIEERENLCWLYGHVIEMYTRLSSLTGEFAVILTFARMTTSGRSKLDLGLRINVLSTSSVDATKSTQFAVIILTIKKLWQPTSKSWSVCDCCFRTPSISQHTRRCLISQPLTTLTHLLFNVGQCVER